MLPACVNIVIISFFITSIHSGNVDQTVLRGVQTSLLSMYIPSKPFTCLDGSLTVPFEFVNDDYCDCQDGSDEPGTSACPNGQFFCENKGYVGTLIPSHFVGDGVCDCCDGSDEYETTVVCNNTCFELAQKLQTVRDAKRALHQAGVVKKKELIANAKTITNERQTQLDELETDLNELEHELKEKEELKKQAELSENVAKEKHKKLWQEKRVMQQVIARNRQVREIFADLDINEDSLVSIDELQRHTELDKNQANEFTIDEVRSILGAKSVNLDQFNKTVFDKISDSYQKLPEPTRPTPEPTPLPEPSAQPVTTASPPLETFNDREEATTSSPYWYENEEDDNERDYQHASSTIITSLEHEKHIHDSTVPEYDDATKSLIQLADQARNEYNQVKESIIHMKRKIQDLKKESNVDLGPNSEYAPILDQCFDYEEREYTYQICMFKTARQIPKGGGGGEITLGYWDSWFGPKENKYLSMKYTNGATCWNGPARSLTVTLECSVEQKLIDAREPSRCEYTVTFQTPLACDERIATTSSHPDHVEF